MSKPSQLYLIVAWREDGASKRNADQNRITLHVGDLLEPTLTNQEMQHIAFAAKMEFAKICHRRKKVNHDVQPV